MARLALVGVRPAPGCKARADVSGIDEIGGQFVVFQKPARKPNVRNADLSGVFAAGPGDQESFGRPIVTVCAARTAAPSGPWPSEGRPLGTSTETTGIPEALTASIIAAT